MKKFAIAFACLIALGTGSVAFANGGFGPGKHFEKIDTNGDGKVSKAEHTKAADERFARMDANKDGVLSQDEMPGRGHKRGHGNCDHEGKGHKGPKQGAPQGAAGSAGR
jgi:hypothetical protein